MSWIDNIPSDVINLALKGAEALARIIAAKLGLADDLVVIERIKNRMLESAFLEGVDLGLALSELERGVADIPRALELAAKVGAERMDFPKDLIELEVVGPMLPEGEEP
jgi:hypothetical protein